MPISALEALTVVAIGVATLQLPTGERSGTRASLTPVAKSVAPARHAQLDAGTRPLGAAAFDLQGATGANAR